jgi:hypothetical protein
MKTALVVLSALAFCACHSSARSGPFEWPSLFDLDKIAAQNVDATGRAAHITNISLRQDKNGNPVWRVGVMTWDGSMPTPALAAKLRAKIAKYSDAPVVFEKGFRVHANNGHLAQKPPSN